MSLWTPKPFKSPFIHPEWLRRIHVRARQQRREVAAGDSYFVAHAMEFGFRATRREIVADLKRAAA